MFGINRIMRGRLLGGLPVKNVNDQRCARRYVSNEGDAYRSAYERDCDRILYSSAFRRLGGVTQVAAVSEQRVLHTRLTHSLKVAQMGRRLAQRMLHPACGDPDLRERAGLEPDVVEAACLAHDLGHPPFGHLAEEVLDHELKVIDGLEGFEGNAQSFRILTKLARRRQGHPGLDLTRATLDAVLKYPRLRAQVPPKEWPSGVAWTDRTQGSKWGAYASEATDFEWVRCSSQNEIRCANAVLMDWADDITFATHDIEDYFRAGLIPLTDLGRDVEKIRVHAKDRLTHAHEGFNGDQFDIAFDSVMDGLNGGLRDRYWATRKNRSWLNSVTSKNLSDFVHAVTVGDTYPYLQVDSAAQYKVEVLKELTWFYVIDTPTLAMMQEGQRRIIKCLYQRLCGCLRKDPSSGRIPLVLREIYSDIQNDNDACLANNKEACRARAVADYVCSLTEGQAIDLVERLNGTTKGSMFDAWFT
jgi:dGTPase